MANFPIGSVKSTTFSGAARPASAPVVAEKVDRWIPTGEVAIPSPKSYYSFPTTTTIDDKAKSLHKQWAERMGGKEKCVVGILCERGWTPNEEHDEVLDIADAIMDAGGMPRLLYRGDGDLKGINALAVPGGRDVDPAKYGAKLGPAMDPKEPDSQFDDFEINAIKQVYDQGMPLLGHCRGTQIMNVAAGGTLIQDIPTEFHSPGGWSAHVNHRPEEVRHDYASRLKPVHSVKIEAGSRLSGYVGLETMVNSIHHQCIGVIGPILIPVVHAMDGLVEGVQRKGMPWQAGYQFHPEALRYTDSRFQGIYDQLVSDGARYKNGELTPQG